MGRRYKERHYEKSNFKILKELYSDKKHIELINESNKYLDFYKNNVMVHFMRAKAFRKLELFEDAINELKYILSIESNDYALVELYYIYYYLNKYEDAIKLLPILYAKGLINKYSLSISELIMKKQLGIEIKVKNDGSYIRTQIFDYSTNRALQHLSSHKNTLIEEENRSYFNSSVNLEYLFKIARENIQNSKRSNVDEILDIYYFSIPNIGTYMESMCNYIKVVVVPNTSNIITMFPVNYVDNECVSILECDYSILFNEKVKVKKLSQIDKFNKRFNRV